MYNFPFAFSWTSFLNDYVYQHLIIFPGVIIVVTLCVVFFIRVRGEYILRLNINKAKKYYDRVHYCTLKLLVGGSLACICILIIVGVTLNNRITPRLDDAIDTAFGTIQQTSGRVDEIRGYLEDLQAKLRRGFNGTGIVSDKQAIILQEIDGINQNLINMSTILNGYSVNTIRLAANLSAESRDILASLNSYGELHNVPSINEVPEMNATDLGSQISVATTSLNKSISDLQGIRATVADFNININLSSAVNDVQVVVNQTYDVNVQLAVFYNSTEDINEKGHKYNGIRMGVIFTTYAIPLLFGLMGLLTLQLRSFSVSRHWFHCVLIGASLCGICGGLYMTTAVVIDDVCDAPQLAVFTAIHSLTDYSNEQWYDYINQYYFLLTHCTADMNFIDYVNLPPEVDNILNQSTSLRFYISTNYSNLITNATDQLDDGYEAFSDVNFEFANLTGTKLKLEGIKQQISNLTTFGFSFTLYNETLDSVNNMTYSINVTFPNNDTSVEYSLYYTPSNISLLEINQFPYNYTNSNYSSELDIRVTAFKALDTQYHTLLNLTAAMAANITKLELMLDSINNASKQLDVLKADANISIAKIHLQTQNITAVIANLSAEVEASLLPQIGILDEVWAQISNATNCLFVAEAYNHVLDFICVTAMEGSVAYVTTQLICGAFLCVLSFTALYGTIVFRKPYKPYQILSNGTSLSSMNSSTSLTSPSPPPPERSSSPPGRSSSPPGRSSSPPGRAASPPGRHPFAIERSSSPYGGGRSVPSSPSPPSSPSLASSSDTLLPRDSSPTRRKAKVPKKKYLNVILA